MQCPRCQHEIPAGARVRVSGRHCAGRGKAPARAWCKCGWWAEGVRCRKVAALHQAPSGSGAQGRERRAALSAVAISPRRVARCAPSSQTRSPYAAGNAAIACVSARPAERPRQLAGLPAPALPGCRPLLKRVRGSAPNNPRRRQPLAGVRAWVAGRRSLPARSKAGARCGSPSCRRVRWSA